MSVFFGSRQLIANSREIVENTVATVELGFRPSGMKPQGSTRNSAGYMRIKEEPDQFDEYILAVQSTSCWTIWCGFRAHEEKACLLDHVIVIFQRTTNRIEKSPPWLRLKRLHDLKCSMHMYGAIAWDWLEIFSEVITEVFDPVPTLAQTERMWRGLQDIMETVCGPGELTVAEWAKKYFTQVNLFGSASRQSLCGDHSKTFRKIRSLLKELQQEFEDCFILKCVLDSYAKDFRHGRGHVLTASWDFTLEEMRKGELLAWTAIGVQMQSLVDNEQLELKSTLFGSNHLREGQAFERMLIETLPHFGFQLSRLRAVMESQSKSVYARNARFLAFFVTLGFTFGQLCIVILKDEFFARRHGEGGEVTNVFFSQGNFTIHH